MATFKKNKFKTQKKFTAAPPGAAAAPPDETVKLAEMMGLEDDDEPAPAEVPNTDYNDGIDYNNNEDDDEETDDGFSFVEFIDMQKSLRKVCEAQIELKDDLKNTKRELAKTQYKLDRAEGTHKMQIGITMAAQKNQLEELHSMISSLTLTVEELEEAANGGEKKGSGVAQLVDTMKNMSDEKRKFEELASLNQGSYNQAQKDLLDAEMRAEETSNAQQEEIMALRDKLGDPVKIDVAMDSAGQNTASSAVVKVMKEEITRLQNELEITTAQKKAAEASHGPGTGSGITSEQAERYESDLKAKKAMISKLETELRDARANVAKLRALSASGPSEAESTASAQARSDEMATMTKRSKEQDLEIEELKEKLKREIASHEAKKKELAEIRDNLGEEMAKIQGSAAAGEDSAKELAAELAKERQALKSEQAEHEATKGELETLRAEVHTVKETSADAAAQLESKIREVTEQHATKIQAAKADAAAEVAELKQRHDDDMKDLRARLGSFVNIVQPMLSTYKELSGQYRKLRSEVTELAATIEPAVKQVKRDLLKTLSEVDRQYKEMLTKYRKEMTLRKKLHNQLVDLKGNIRVFCRIRPKIGEDGDGPNSQFTIKADARDDQLCIYSDPKTKKSTTFDFTRTFGPESKQVDVFEEAKDLILSVIDGYNVCIFAYGQTGSGKTFTMEGIPSDPGLNKRALAALFETCAEKSADWTYSFEVSVMEIYNETLRDLLNPDKKANNKLDIKHGKDGPHVPGLIRERVNNQEEVEKWFNQAKSIRSTASTDMNEHSSRSHCLLVVYVQGTNLSTGVQSTGKLNLIDLAGSERVAKSGAIDDAKRLKEATNINKSLSSLGDVIHALGEKQKHVPFRNSKLTHFLQDSLGGAAKTLMVVQISPVIKNGPESKCSLNFADRVKKVELGSAKKQSESAEMAALRKRIRELESQ